MLGVALLAGLTLGSVAVARGRGFSCARIALDMVGAIVGAGVGAIPGAGLGIGPLITVSVEGGANVVVPLALLAVGGAAGYQCGVCKLVKPAE
jgi:hypothetical protein